jgi:aspartate/methionine/tyrosine aminotransferase
VFSKRLTWNPPENALAALARRQAEGGGVLDLTESNPTRVGLDYPSGPLRLALAGTNVASYAPAPLGIASARAAVAAEYARAGVEVDPARIVLTASTSESYGFLFKLLADPGDAVLVPEPSYPLFEYLARLEGVVPAPYRLGFDGAWHLGADVVERGFAASVARGARPRAIVVVSPNNPTGSFLKRAELAKLGEVCARHDLALICDEVFAGYGFAADASRVPTLAAEPALADVVPSFSLGGLSKSCGLPQLKLGWIVVGGPDPSGALAALELIADTALSVATPVQEALPELLALGAEVRTSIRTRVTANVQALAALVPPASGCTVLPVEGGWSAIVRVPATRSDEAWAGALLADAGVLVHPGYFFDLEGGVFLVVSLLPPTDVFAEGIRRLVALVGATRG